MFNIDSTLLCYFLYTEEQPTVNVFPKHEFISFEIKESFISEKSLK
jgi:hypothetical protein